MARKNKRKKIFKAAFYKEYNLPRHIGYEWYSENEKPVEGSIETIYHKDYIEHFHPYNIMQAMNCRKRV